MNTHRPRLSRDYRDRWTPTERRLAARASVAVRYVRRKQVTPIQALEIVTRPELAA
jgi:hypothetical protein